MSGAPLRGLGGCFRSIHHRGSAPPLASKAWFAATSRGLRVAGGGAVENEVALEGGLATGLRLGEAAPASFASFLSLRFPYGASTCAR